MKKTTLIILLFSILLISTANALIECNKNIFPIDSPCLVFLQHNTSISDCSLLNVTFYRNATFLSTKYLSNYSNFLCNSTFDFTSIGTYTFSYSTGDTGSITIIENINNTYYLYVVALIIFVFLMWFGYYLKESNPITIAGFLIGVIGIYLFLNGFPNLTNTFLKDSVSIILIGLSFFLIVAPNLEEIQNLF